MGRAPCTIHASSPVGSDPGQAGRPEVPREVDALTDEVDAFASQADAVGRERRLPARAYYAVARHIAVVAPAQRAAHRAGGERPPGEQTNEAVARDAAGRDLADHRVHAPRPCVGHRSHTARR